MQRTLVHCSAVKVDGRHRLDVAMQNRLKCQGLKDVCKNAESEQCTRTRVPLAVYVCMVITYSKGMDQAGKVANPARSQLNMNISLSPFAPDNLVSRDGFDSPVPRQPAHSPYRG